MRLHFAGAENAAFNNLLKNNNVESILQSAFYLDYKKKLNSFIKIC